MIEIGMATTGPSVAEKLVEFCKEYAELFRTDDGVAYASVDIRGHAEHVEVSGKIFQNWLTAEFVNAGNSPPSSLAVRTAIDQVIAQTCNNGMLGEVHLRAARSLDTLYVDLLDEDRNCVKIDEDGWEIVSGTPIKFIRKPGMSALPKPEAGGSLDLLRDCLPALTDDQWVLVKAFIVGSFNPQFALPVLAVSGPQGSGKTTLANTVRQFIDPNAAPVRSLSGSIDDLYVAAANSRLLVFDNLSSLSQRMSDELCRITSGTAYSKRRLYTDADEVQISVTRPVILTGIPDYVSQPDLADRTLRIELGSTALRRSQASIQQELDRLKGKIAGGIFDALSAAMRKDGTELQGLPRLADFASFVSRAESQLGIESGGIISAMRRNASDRDQEIAEQDEFCNLILQMLGDKESLIQTAGETAERLNELGRRRWNARKVAAELKRKADLLHKSGVAADQQPREAGRRPYLFSRLS